MCTHSLPLRSASENLEFDLLSDMQSALYLEADMVSVGGRRARVKVPSSVGRRDRFFRCFRCAPRFANTHLSRREEDEEEQQIICDTSLTRILRVSRASGKCHRADNGSE